MAKGIWADKNTFVPIKDRRSLGKEFAPRSRSMDFWSVLSYLPNPDPVLKKLGRDIKVYRDLQVDDHVEACVSSRKAGVTKLEWRLDRTNGAKAAQTKVIGETIQTLKLTRLLEEILDAALFGYQPLEIDWQLTQGLLLPRSVRAKPVEWFKFGSESELRFLSRENMLQGEPVPDKKFLLPRRRASYANPYGDPALSRCFWPVAFKRGGLGFWTTFVEKYGMPYLVGKLPRGSATEDYDKLMDSLEDMVADAVAVIPDDGSVEFITSNDKGDSSELYHVYLNYQDKSISKGLLGQTLSTDVGDTGSYAASKSHMEVRSDIIDADKQIAEEAINELIGWIGELNFSGPMPKFELYEEEDVDKDLADRDKVLTEALGAGRRLSTNYFEVSYKLKPGDIEEVEAADSGDDGGADDYAEAAGRFEPEGLLAGLSAEAMHGQVEEALKPVLSLVQSAKSLGDIRERLAPVFSEMDSEQVEETLAKLIFVAQVTGRLDADA